MDGTEKNVSAYSHLAGLCGGNVGYPLAPTRFQLSAISCIWKAVRFPRDGKQYKTRKQTIIQHLHSLLSMLIAVNVNTAVNPPSNNENACLKTCLTFSCKL